MTLALPVGAVMNCADNSGAKSELEFVGRNGVGDTRGGCGFDDKRDVEEDKGTALSAGLGKIGRGVVGGGQWGQEGKMGGRYRVL